MKKLKLIESIRFTITLAVIVLVSFTVISITFILYSKSKSMFIGQLAQSGMSISDYAASNVSADEV
jgi:uncharacterized Tic20 family protein